MKAKGKPRNRRHPRRATFRPGAGDSRLPRAPNSTESGMRVSRRSVLSAAFAAAVVSLAGALVMAAGQQPPAAASAPVDYNWDVRPILSENCFQCHGPDEKGRRVNLRLDQREGSTRVLNATTGRR